MNQSPSTQPAPASRPRAPMWALLQRELVTQMRTRRLLLAVVISAILGSWMVLGQWPGSTNFVWSQMVSRAESLFVTFSVVSLTVGPLIVGAVAATSFVGERERDSWDLLRLSLITRAGLVFGKLLSPIALFLLVIVACAPVFAALLFLAGLDPLRVAASAVITACTAATCSAIAIACSARATKVIAGSTASFVAIAIFMGLHAVIVWVLYELADEVFDLGGTWGDLGEIFFLSPYWALSISFDATRLAELTPVALHLGYQAIVFVCAIGIAAWSIGSDVETVSAGRLGRRKLRTRRNGASRGRARHARSFPNVANPVFRREIYWSSPLSSTAVRRTAAIVGIIGFLMMLGVAVTIAGDTMSEDEKLYVAVLPGLTLFGLLGCLYMPIACAGMYTKEISEATYDMLRTTLLTPSQIVWGKFRAMTVYAGIVWCYGAAICLPMVLWFLRDLEGVMVLLLSYATFYVCLLYAGATALLVSFHSKSTGGAIIGSYFGGFLMFFGLFGGGLMLASAFGATVNDRSASFAVLVMTSPAIAWFWTIIDGIRDTSLDRLYYWAGSALWTAGFACATQIWTIRRFEARVEKIEES